MGNLLVENDNKNGKKVLPHSTKTLDFCDTFPHRIIDFGFRRKASETESDRRMCQILLCADRAQNVRRLQGRRGASAKKYYSF
jgi:hypothetical protein